MPPAQVMGLSLKLLYKLDQVSRARRSDEHASFIVNVRAAVWADDEQFTKFKGAVENG